MLGDKTEVDYFELRKFLESDEAKMELLKRPRWTSKMVRIREKAPESIVFYEERIIHLKATKAKFSKPRDQHEEFLLNCLIRYGKILDFMKERMAILTLLSDEFYEISKLTNCVLLHILRYAGGMQGYMMCPSDYNATVESRMRVGFPLDPPTGEPDFLKFTGYISKVFLKEWRERRERDAKSVTLYLNL